MQDAKPNITQLTLSVTFIVVFAGASLWVLSPFLLALCWASTIVIATWPVMITLQARVGGYRWLAALVMTQLVLVVFALPLVFVVTTMLTHTGDIAGWVNSAQTFKIPTAPQWLENLPMVGERSARYWNDFAEAGLAPWKPYAKQAFSWFASQLGTVGAALVHILFTLVIAAILYVTGDTAAAGVRQFFRRLAGDRGDRAVLLAAQAVRGVALGVVVTALAQTAISGIGLAIVDMPLAGPLTLLILALCIAQLGPTLVLVPAVIWMYLYGESNAWATVLLVFSFVAGTMDNVLRPYLIKKGADLPILLIFAGVIGGLMSVGVVGIFVGPVVLAVTYRLLEEWVRENPVPSPALTASPHPPGPSA